MLNEVKKRSNKIRKWIDSHKYVLLKEVECDKKLYSENFEYIEHHLKFTVQFYQNAFNQRKIKVVKSNYDQCFFSGSEKEHDYFKSYVNPWLKGKNIYPLPYSFNRK